MGLLLFGQIKDAGGLTVFPRIYARKFRTVSTGAKRGATPFHADARP